MIRISLGCTLLCFVLVQSTVPAQPLNGNFHEVKNVIFMVPDGMGLANLTATRLRLGDVSKPLNLETLEHVGYQRNYSKTNLVTDSSAAASAWTCGEKFVNNEVCMHGDGTPANQNLFELAKSKGMATAIVVTQTVTHATPAAFAAHVVNRNCETMIASKYIGESKPDILLGGGQAIFNPSSPDACNYKDDYIAKAKEAHYTYITTNTELAAAAASNTMPLLGLFASKALTPEYLRPANTTQPRLPEMTGAALSMLEHSKRGFFLMVEGSLIDSGNHAENMDYQFGEITAFDQSVRVVLDWIAASPERQQHTLLIVAVDHETGGFALKGVGVKAGELPNAGFAGVPNWAFTLNPDDKNDFEAHHTASDVMIWSQGPGSESLGHAIDNTFVYQVIKSALKL